MPLGLRPYVNQLVQVKSIMTQIIVDSQVLIKLEQHDHEQFEQLPDGYEVDSVENTGARGWGIATPYPSPLLNFSIYVLY
ncbi:hypothetical protein DSM106972_090510 [Dulcicalothrix desertica PCC 7102]|uniref:Uncharacterized protein n=1 Tax=Dulcicalothrix desertica PCC 7102 TaxID=232991 RepID=A0A3S5K316_9CYAN|nr:hypothetical protein [Dulcicalothrix desertica]RUS95275.1 hypothetical protein DSM106972_090510 [Dulcicalothrix desertica PCC 7102]TWH43967.1 hypothetical protein CAL7102_07726 [Dulcicalothrix desertica PCC 7102]